VKFFRCYWPLLALAAIAFVVSTVVRDRVFPLYSGNRDEPVYVAQADALLEGEVTTPTGGKPAFFQPWLHGERDGRFFSSFPPGWPLVLAAADLVLGSKAIAIALAAASVVWGTYLLTRELTRDHAHALLAAALMTASPILIIQSGLYVSYLYTLALGLLFGSALLAAVRTRRRWFAVAAGACLGVLLLTRPLDAVLWALPFLGYAAFRWRSERRQLLALVAMIALGFVPFVVVTLAYNHHVTGSPTEFPITAAEPLNGFGFGPRRIEPTAETLDYTPRRALQAARDNFEHLPPWAFGGFAGIGIALVGVVLSRRRAWAGVLLGICAVFPAAYLGYWGLELMADGAEGIGPQYYIPLFVPICCFTAVALRALWRRQRLVGAATGAVLAALTVPVIGDKADAGQFASSFSEPWVDTLDAAGVDDALVFMPDSPYLLVIVPTAANQPDLDGSVLYAVDRGPRNLELIEERRGRRPFRLTRELREDDELFDPTYFLQALSVDGREVVTFRMQIKNPGNESTVVAYLEVGGRELAAALLDASSVRGRTYDLTFAVAPPAGDRADGALPLPDRRGTVSVGVWFGSGTARTDRSTAAEQRFGYRVTGERGAAQEVEVLRPGAEWKRFDFPEGPTWLRADTAGMLDVGR
jgi:4-amino-4-deoxy-L-arabinose transferase-like glycosyltransferase